MAISGATDPGISLSRRVRLNPDFVFREEESGFLLYDSRQDVLFEGNDTGRQILALCTGRFTCDEIITICAGSWQHSRNEAAGYIFAFLKKLQEKGIVEQDP